MANGTSGPRLSRGPAVHYFDAPKPRKSSALRHLTIKPEALMRRLIEVFSIEGNLVLDPFLGSGTTAVAALQTQRRFVGFEIEKEYYEQAKQRLITHLT